MPRRTTLSHVFRTAPAKALLATGCASAAAGLLLAFPPTASATTAGATSGNIVLPSHGPFPSFSFVFPTSAQASTVKPPVTKTTTPVAHHHQSSAPASPQGSQQPQFNYVSTFSPAPVILTSPNSNATVSCLANTQPLTGSGGDLDLPGIPGSSKDPGHVGALPIGTMGPTTMLPPQVDSSSLTQLSISRTIDAASTNLSMIASSGYRFPCIHIELGAGKGYRNVEYALVNAGLVADDRSGKNEILTWTYSTILWSYSVPGSTKVHQGAGQINAQPNVVTRSVAQDTRAIAAGTIGLTAVVALALIILYVMGIRRNRKRYRQRFQRRAELRAEREAMMVAVEAAQAAQEAEAARWAEVAAREAEARAAEERRRAAAEAEREAEAIRAAEAEREAEALREAEQQREQETEEPEESEAEDSEPESEAETEVESESEHEPEEIDDVAPSDEPAADEPEPEHEPKVEVASEPQSETELEHAAESEPVTEAESVSESPGEDQVEVEVEDQEQDLEPEQDSDEAQVPGSDSDEAQDPDLDSDEERESDSESDLDSGAEPDSDSDSERESDAGSSESAGYRKTPV